MNTVMLAVAPVPKKSAGIPFNYSPEHVSGEVIACAHEGAVMAHLHVLDEHGNETTDLSVFDETLRLIQRESDIIIQGSTVGFENAMPALEAVLRFMLEQLAKESGTIIGVLHNRGVDFSFLRLALDLGVDIVRQTHHLHC